jgi:DUF1680 family protein
VGHVKRRTFLGTAAAAVPAFRAAARSARPDTPAPLARPFPLARVRLLPGPVADAAEVNRRFLAGMDEDRLLHVFRVNAGLPSSAEPLGGWEAPVNELRGHYVGHYLSACAMRAAGFGDAALGVRGERLVAELARCQQALGGSGYLSAFPEEFFDRLRDGRGVWAPFYTVHKIMAGLLDMHVMAGSAQALDVVKGMARWADRWSQPLGEAHMARVLEREYGGMNEVLYNLAAVTGNEAWRETAHRFDHERLFGPLAAGRDELKGLHVNTTIPKIIGAARRWELTGEPRYRAVAEYFWREVTGHRAFCTGGTSSGESWNTDPGVMASELNGYTQEDCTSYNMLKLTGHLFSWTAEAACADYHERVFWNGIMGTQHPDDGSKLYYVPLVTGYWKLFGAPLHDFWCCTGSMSESFAKLAEGVYYQDDGGLWVNQFVASELDWQEKGVRLVQETRFPDEETTTLTVHVARPTRFALRVRVPSWAKGGSATLGGRTLDAFAAPGGYVVLDRTWRDGERVSFTFPMSLRAVPMPDDPGLQALAYGPMVLVSRLGSEGLTPATLRAEPTRPRTVPEYQAEPVAAPPLRVRSADPADWVRRSGSGVEFRTIGQEREIVLVPFHTLFDERYGVYWRVVRGG